MKTLGTIGPRATKIGVNMYYYCTQIKFILDLGHVPLYKISSVILITMMWPKELVATQITQKKLEEVWSGGYRVYQSQARSTAAYLPVFMILEA